MSIEQIDSAKCIGCGTCVISCPADVIRIDKESKKAVIKYREDCALCFWCLAECPVGAVKVLPYNTSPLFVSWG
jgi:NAD-dependent dihydropyrimidine dehydrogenase PreA subunit